MAKVLKVKIGRNQTAEKTSYTYPPEYDASKIQVMCYESQLEANYDIVVGRGNTDEYLIGVVDDVDAAGFLASKDITELSVAEAKIQGAVWTSQMEKITDQSKVLMICAKAAAGTALTKEEKDALNPDNPAPGINKSRSFSESLDDLVAKPSVKA